MIDVVESLARKGHNGQVRFHTTKLLWVLRDRPELAKWAQVVVESVACVKEVGRRNGWLQHSTSSSSSYLHDNWVIAMQHQDSNLEVSILPSRPKPLPLRTACICEKASERVGACMSGCVRERVCVRACARALA